MVSSAPGSLKLFGEHAVVYNRLGLSAAFDRRAEVKIKEGKEKVLINLVDFKQKESFGKEEIERSYKRIRNLIEYGDFDELKREKQDVFAPHKFILGSFFEKQRFSAIEVEITSQIPRSSGLGSSAGVFAALANELDKFFGMRFEKKELVELANLGDKVVHGKPSGLDANTCVYGGYVSFRRSEGVKILKIKTEVPILVVNTKISKDTGEMVAKVAELYKNNRKKTDEIFDMMEETAKNGIHALETNDLHGLGVWMNEAQTCFRELGLSLKEVEDVIKIANLKGACGAKLTGAGGGGCVIVLIEKSESLIQLYKKLGYDAFETKLGVEGVM
jgi:mevalonate kinase